MLLRTCVERRRLELGLVSMLSTVDLADADCSGRGDESDICLLERTGEEIGELLGDLLAV